MNQFPNRIFIMPEYGKPWKGTVIRVYPNSMVAVVHPDDQSDDVTVRVDLEFTGWASLDQPVIIPDDISSEDDYNLYSALANEQ
jgi:hypothetical protein